ncbi:ABC transporter substrate-binding protein [Streptomyces canus]|uniref:ABC transporter substrate-binding protein n=1 Tax=Streptomyces canus TaxID=58343 RepID=UPI0033F4B579
MKRQARRFAASILALAATAALSSCAGSGTGADGGKGSLTIVTFGGTTGEGFKKAVAEPFTKATGIGTQVTDPVDYGKYTAQYKSGKVDWDYADFEGFYIAQHLGWWAPTDTGIVKYKTTDTIDLPGDQPGTDDLLPGGSYAFTIAYHTDNDKPHPKTWADFFDTKKFPGKRAMYNWPYGMLEAALLADGVPFDHLYPLDIPRALKKLDTIKDDIVFWNSGAELQQMMSTGEADYAFAWNNRIADLQRKGAPVANEWGQNIQDGTYLVTAKNNPQAKDTMKLFDFMLQPKNQASLAERTGYSPGTKPGFALIPDKDKQYYNVDPKNLQQAAGSINLKWWAENFDSTVEKWNAWAGQ